jgi:hypothetical protein
MFAGKNKDARKLIVFHWSDGSRDPFFRDLNPEKFIQWKLNKYPELSHTTEEMTVGEYNTKYTYPDGQN